MNNELTKLKKECFLKAIAAIGFISLLLVLLLNGERFNTTVFAMVVYFSVQWSIDFIITLVKYIKIKNGVQNYGYIISLYWWSTC